MNITLDVLNEQDVEDIDKYVALMATQQKKEHGAIEAAKRR